MADLARRFCHLYKRQEILGQAVEILSFLVLALVYLCFFFVCGLLCVLLNTNIVAVLIVISVATEEKQQLKCYYPRNELIITKYS